MAKVKIPFKKFPLKRDKRRRSESEFKPAVEGVTVASRGYWPGSSYSDAEKEFMEAVTRWQRKHRSKFLSHTAYLRIALELGYRRVPPPTPPTTTTPTPMNATAILERMLNARFTFARDPDGQVSFVPPPDVSTPERQHLLGVVAWSWSWLAEHAEKFVTQEVHP